MSTRSETPLLLLALVLANWPSRAYAQTDRRVPRMEMPKRVALVIGNDAYPGMPLRNAVNDARAIAGILRDIGFETHLKENATKVAFEQAVDDFAGRLGPGDVGLFYYAGHGIEIARENYLVPIDFNGRTRADAKYESYAARQVLDKMQESGAKFRMMVLDACRNNPYSGRSGGGGLAKMEAATGEFVAFATAPNRTASDSPSADNGLFTAHLIKALKQPGLKVQELFKRVQEEVFQASNGQQMPYAEDGVIGNFYPNPAGQLSAPTQAAATVAATSPSNVSDMWLQVETEFWKSADAANTVDAYEAYLTRYPTGTFALLATAKLKTLGSGPATTSPGSLLRPVTPVTMRYGSGDETVPSALATPLLRAETTPTHTELAQTGPVSVHSGVPPPTLPTPSSAAATSPQGTEISSASPSSAPSTPALEAPGTLILKVKPWAEVTIDGRAMGRALLPKISLSPGPHTLVLVHPDFEPFKRILAIRSGATSSLAVDLKDEAVRRKH